MSTKEADICGLRVIIRFHPGEDSIPWKVDGIARRKSPDTDWQASVIQQAVFGNRYSVELSV